jgi:hypothetical protein
MFFVFSGNALQRYIRILTQGVHLDEFDIPFISFLTVFNLVEVRTSTVRFPTYAPRLLFMYLGLRVVTWVFGFQKTLAYAHYARVM